jgi:hypothetical protein
LQQRQTTFFGQFGAPVKQPPTQHGCNMPEIITWRQWFAGCQQTMTSVAFDVRAWDIGSVFAEESAMEIAAQKPSDNEENRRDAC